MQCFRSAALFSLALFALCASANADCPPWRPCGSGNTWGGNRLVPQGAWGADFRPACQRHDDCLATCTDLYGQDRYECDLNDACECSRHPHLCRCRARCYYIMARLFGGIYH